MKSGYGSGKNQSSDMYDSDERKPFPMHERVKAANDAAILNVMPGGNQNTNNTKAYDASVMSQKLRWAGMSGKK